MALGLLKNKKKKKECQMAFFTSRGEHVNGAIIHSSDWKSAVEYDGGVQKCVIVYLARDIPAFVMYYYVYGESGPSLLIESTDSMIIIPKNSYISLIYSQLNNNSYKTLEQMSC